MILAKQNIDIQQHSNADERLPTQLECYESTSASKLRYMGRHSFLLHTRSMSFYGFDY